MGPTIPLTLLRVYVASITFLLDIQIGISLISKWQLLPMLERGKHICHKKVSTRHSLNKVWDTRFVLVKPVVQPYHRAPNTFKNVIIIPMLSRPKSVLPTTPTLRFRNNPWFYILLVKKNFEIKIAISYMFLIYSKERFKVHNAFTL